MGKFYVLSFKFYVGAMALLVLAGCVTGRAITGHPPQLDVHSVSRDGQVIVLALSLRNINDEVMALSAIDLRLEFDDNLLLQIEQPLALTVPARGRERVRVERVGALAGLEALDGLEQNQVASLPWQLQGRLLNADGRPIRVEARGHLYPVPGRPGEFR